ncbi:MAG: hypothetical protein CL534_13350 [Ahrensia sp.]|nr:hypothetical protein [Ahrensia sp.]
MTSRLRLPIAALVALLALGSVALGAAPLDREALADRLFERLAAATTEEEGRRAEDAVWEMWIDHPDAEIRDAIALGMRQRESYDWDAALQTFSGVIESDPGYAEGWNQRAFIHFLKGDYDASLADLDKTLELEPRHFGALAGVGLIYLSTNRFDEGQEILRQAVALHPFLKERRMLVPQ